jgi:hypothetical protein
VAIKYVDWRENVLTRCTWQDYEPSVFLPVKDPGSLDIPAENFKSFSMAMTHPDLSSEESKLQPWYGVCLVILALLPFVLFWPVTVGSKIWTMGDIASYHIPTNAVAADLLRHAKLPLWNPYLEGGTPLAAAQNSGIYYPVNVLLWLFVPPWTMFGYSVLIHFALIGVATFCFLRSLRLRLLSALAGGLVFELAGFTMSQLGHVMILRALPWIAFSLAAYNLWIDSRRARYLALLAASMCCLYLSGFIQIIVYSSLLIGTYVVFARRAPLRQWIMAVLAMGLGIGLSGIQIFSGAALWLTNEYLRPGEGMYSLFTSCSFHPIHVLTLLFAHAPLGIGAEMVGYVGIIPLFLALIAVVTTGSPEENRIKRFFMIWAGCSLILAFGRYLDPLARLTFHIPLYRDFSVMSKHLMEFDFSMAVLAAYGMEEMIRRQWFRRVKITRVVTLGLFVAWIAFLAIRSPISGDTSPLKWTPRYEVVVKPLLLMLGGIGLILLTTLLDKKKSRFALAALVLVVVIDLADFGVPIYSAGLGSDEFYNTIPTTVTRIQRMSKDLGPFRILSIEAPGGMADSRLAQTLLGANYFAFYKLESLIGHEGLQLRQFNIAFKGRIPPWGNVEAECIRDLHFRALMDVYGVRYILARDERAPILSEYYSLISSDNGVSLFENPQARPRLFTLYSNATEDNLKPGNSVKITHYEENRISASIQFCRDGFLVHGTNIATGWKATLDHKSVPIQKGEGATQKILVPAGSHEVEFYFMPDSFKWGLASSFLSILLVVALVLLNRSRSNSPPP